MKVKLVLLTLCMFCFVGCAEIKPMQLPTYSPPDLSKVVRPEIAKLEEGTDYTIDLDNNKVCYAVSGQNKLTAKVTSEQVAWQEIEMIKQMVDLQTQIIQQKDFLIVQIDLQRQYSERGRTYADARSIVAEIVAVIGIALAIGLK